MKPVVEYDRESDAVYLRLSDAPYAFGEDLDRERRIDYAADGTPIGVELTCVSSGVDLRDLPHRDEIDRALRGLGVRVLA